MYVQLIQHQSVEKNYPFSIGLPLSVFYWKSLHSWCCGKILNLRWAHWGPEEGLCESSRNVLRACGTRRVYSAGATTHWHTLGLNSGRLCLTVLEATSPGWRYQQACFLLSPFSLGCRRLPFSLCPHMVFFLCTHPWCICVQISSCKDTSHVGLSPSQWPHYWDDHLKALSPFMVVFWDTGVMASTYEFWGGTVQPITELYKE